MVGCRSGCLPSAVVATLILLRHARSAANGSGILAGRSPGVMQSYAPNAAASPVEGWVEDDETVHRLAHWREEAIY